MSSSRTFQSVQLKQTNAISACGWAILPDVREVIAKHNEKIMGPDLVTGRATAIAASALAGMPAT
jgi:hypothetical protein